VDSKLQAFGDKIKQDCFNMVASLELKLQKDLETLEEKNLSTMKEMLANQVKGFQGLVQKIQGGNGNESFFVLP
jgi:hypothetical protein